MGIECVGKDFNHFRLCAHMISRYNEIGGKGHVIGSIIIIVTLRNVVVQFLLPPGSATRGPPQAAKGNYF